MGRSSSTTTTAAIQENVTFEEFARCIASRLQLAAQGQQPIVSIDTR